MYLAIRWKRRIRIYQVWKQYSKIGDARLESKVVQQASATVQ